MSEPTIWTLAELTHDAETAKMLFRQQRMDEPLERYSSFFKMFAPIFGDIINRLPALSEDPVNSDIVAELMRDGDMRTAFRYLAAPPVSEDDLKTLAGTTLSATALRSDTEQARRVRDIVLHIIDPHRFPWVKKDRDPTQDERGRAIVASAALVAVRKVETSRRTNAKMEREDVVKAMLHDIGFTEARSHDIPLLEDAPAPGEFCGESKLGDTRADLVIRLFDRRAMALECKASHSAVNSYKRVNHEAAGKAHTWLAQFGKLQIVPGAIISGVFNPNNLETAQGEGLALFWSHRLRDLADFIESTRSRSAAGNMPGFRQSLRQRKKRKRKT